MQEEEKGQILGLLKGAEPDTVLSFPAEVDGCIGATSAKMGEMKDKIQDSVNLTLEVLHLWYLWGPCTFSACHRPGIDEQI